MSTKNSNDSGGKFLQAVIASDPDDQEVPVRKDLSAGTVNSVPSEDPELPAPGRARLEALFSADPLMAQLGAELVIWSPGAATVQVTMNDNHTNFLGGGHGGIIFSLGDIAMSFASNGYGRLALATQIDISYHRGVRPGDLVVATATEISRTRRFGHHRVELKVNDRLVATATGTSYRTDEWHFGAEIWPDEWREKY